MTLYLAISLGLLLLLVVAISLYISLNRREVVRYIDTGGINKNPPAFIETWANKTINFKLGKHVVSINHLPIIENLEYIGKIGESYKVIKHGLDEVANNPLGNLDKKTLYLAHYMSIVDIIYKLSKPFTKKWGYKKAFYKKANTDSNWIFGLSEQILDYWLYMGKMLGALAKTKTPRMIYGEFLTSDNLKWDSRNRRLITPRFGFIPKSKLKRLKT